MSQKNTGKTIQAEMAERTTRNFTRLFGREPAAPVGVVEGEDGDLPTCHPNDGMRNWGARRRLVVEARRWSPTDDR